MPKFYRISKTQIACYFNESTGDVRRFNPPAAYKNLYDFDAIVTDYDPIKRKELKASKWFIIGTLKDFDNDEAPQAI